MTIILEVSRPFQLRPGKHANRLHCRVWWLWFAISWLKISYKEWVETPKQWEYR